MNTTPSGRGLALSGGGYRATLFHLGALWRLNELGWLKTFDDITSVSGGSITAAWLAVNWDELAFDADGVATAFEPIVVKPLREFCSRGIDIKAGLAGLLNPFSSGAKQLIKAYDSRLFNGRTLQDLPDPGIDGVPRFTLYATNLQTGVSVRMARDYMADYTLGKIDLPQIPLALATAASSAFPPVFCPVKLETDPGSWTIFPDAELSGRDDLRRQMLLGDGGIYDNMGLQRLINRRQTILISDAGAPIDVADSIGFDYLRRTLRVLDILTEQTRALRKAPFVRELQQGVRQGTYWGISTKIGDYASDTVTPIVQDSQATADLASVRTRLDAFADAEQKALINWGYALTDAAMRRYVQENAQPGRLPY
ncbi:MAG: patatin-like phospholipase family protein [Rhodospirillales bacterium]|nr:patatin-like phospholipase family protein [Rhodospirillales bacterium]MBO6785229.1 patatin-like phospholipase family protein [Rhodospirillales bacterium]